MNTPIKFGEVLGRFGLENDMTRDEVIKLAREADMDVDHAESNAWGAVITAEPADLERFAALVAAAEREECAKVCDETLAHHYIKKMVDKDQPMLLAACADCAAAIRARGNK